MNLRTRIIIIFGAFLAVEIFFFYSLYKWDLSPKIDRLESALVESNISRNIELLQRELFHLEQTGWLLSSLNLIKNADKNDLIQTTMLQQDLNLLYIIDNNNQVVFGKILDLDSFASYPNENFLSTLWKEKPQFIKPTSTPNAQMGIYNSIFGPLLIASIPIKINKASSHVPGKLIIGKLLTPEMIQLFRKITFSTLSIWPLEGATLSKRHLEILKALQETDSNLLTTANNNVIQSYVSLADINQTNNLLLSVSYEREVRKLMMLNLFPACIILIVIQLIFVSFFYWLISKQVNKPLLALIKELNTVHENVFSMRFSNRFWGELEPLVQSLSHFIAQMEKRIAKENTLAYQQGLYFFDKSLLRDVEKTLTPLIDGLTHLENEWLSLPTDKLQCLLAECKIKKVEPLTEDFQKNYLSQLTELHERLTKLQKNAYTYTLKLHQEAHRSTLLLRRHANQLSPKLDFSRIVKPD